MTQGARDAMNCLANQIRDAGGTWTLNSGYRACLSRTPARSL
jgi:hypothetical protein